MLVKFNNPNDHFYQLAIEFKNFLIQLQLPKLMVNFAKQFCRIHDISNKKCELSVVNLSVYMLSFAKCKSTWCNSLSTCKYANATKKTIRYSYNFGIRINFNSEKWQLRLLLISSFKHVATSKQIELIYGKGRKKTACKVSTYMEKVEKNCMQTEYIYGKGRKKLHANSGYQNN